MACRIARDVEMQDLPPIMGDDEESVEDHGGDRVNYEEIHRRDDFAVVPEKCLPSVDHFGVFRRPLDPARNDALRDVKAKHLQFPVNARRAPGGILGDHFEDELSQVFADALSSEAISMA